LLTVALGILLALAVLALLPVLYALLRASARGAGRVLGVLLVLAGAAVPLWGAAWLAAFTANATDSVFRGAGAYVGYGLLLVLPSVLLWLDFRRLR
jgi:hypothetical protein